MGSIAKETLERLVLLYLIGSFKDGVYGNFRFQKVLYFGIKDASKRPFTYKHTDLGQFSWQATTVLEQLASMGYIRVTGLPTTGDSGNRWVLTDPRTTPRYRGLVASYSKELVSMVEQSVKTYGYMPWPELKKIAHDDPALKETPPFNVIFEEDLPDRVEVSLSDDECEELELSLNPKFISAMEKIVTAIETSGFDIGRVERVETLV